MELHQLRYLTLLAQELNFTRAAVRGNVAQPALSRQIRKLEDELGVPLVDRTTRRVTLTDAGIELAERARRVLAEIDAARAAVRQRVELLEGRVVIGMTPTPGPLDVARLLAAFHHRHPGVELALREELSAALADRLRTDAVDLAFVTALAPAHRRQLELRKLATEELVLIVAPGHRLAARPAARIRDLEPERVVAFPTGSTIRTRVDAAAARAGFEPRVAFESYQPARTRQLVSAGLGVAVLPRSDTEQPGAPVAVLPLDGGAIVHEVFIAWRASRTLAPAPAAIVHAALEGAAGAATG